MDAPQLHRRARTSFEPRARHVMAQGSDFAPFEVKCSDGVHVVGKRPTTPSAPRHHREAKKRRRSSRSFVWRFDLWLGQQARPPVAVPPVVGSTAPTPPFRAAPPYIAR